MDSKEKRRSRCSSFSGDEKLLIANICSRYKNILENKNTDHISSEEKNKIWSRIAAEVNSSASNITCRTPDVLKRFYENRKREVRKIAADEKRNIGITGGGQEVKIKKNACHDIILSMMNTKTVYGLDNNFDGDAEPIEIVESNPSSTSSLHNGEIEIVYEMGISAEKGEIRIWKNYIPADLKQPISSCLNNFDDQQEPGPSSGKRTHITEKTFVETDANPSTKKRHTLSTSRRRPTATIKALTRSELAEKYDILLDKRLEIAEYQKKKIEEELLTIRAERQLKSELLQLQIEVEKEKLTKLRERS